MEMRLTYYRTLQFASNETIPTWWHTFIISALRNLPKECERFSRFLRLSPRDRKNQLIIINIHPVFLFALSFLASFPKISENVNIFAELLS